MPKKRSPNKQAISLPQASGRLADRGGTPASSNGHQPASGPVPNLLRQQAASAVANLAANQLRRVAARAVAGAAAQRLTSAAPATASQTTISIPRRSLLVAVSRHLLVLAVFLILSIIFTWPVGAKFATDVPGGGDAWQYLWNIWWVKKSLLDLHSDPFYTNYLYYPGGVTLLFDTTVILECIGALPALLLGASLTQAYNGIVLTSFILGGYGTWLLVRYLTGSGVAALVAGFAFAFCPFHIGRMLGHMNLVSIQWLPFYLWALFHAAGAPGSELDRHFSGRRLAWAGLAGVFLAANFYTEFTFAIFLLLFTALYVGWRGLVDNDGEAAWRRLLNLGATMVVLGLVFAALVGPLLLPTLKAQEGQDWMKPPAQETLVYSSDLLDSFIPSALHPLLGGAAQQLEQRIPERNRTERAAFLGYTTIGVALLGLRRRKALLFWLLTASFFWVLSLGPVLHLNGYSYFSKFERQVTLPYTLLYQFVPGFNVMRVPARFVVIASLALAVLVGYALARLGQWAASRPRFRWPARLTFAFSFALVAGMIMFEFAAVPFPTVTVPTANAFYQQVSADKEQYAILELPIRDLSDYLLLQTMHGKPIIYGKLSRQPQDPFISSRPLLLYLLTDTGPYWLPQKEIAPSLRELQQQNVRYAVVHWWALTPTQAAEMRVKLHRIFPSGPLVDDKANQMTAYEIAPPAPEGAK